MTRFSLFNAAASAVLAMAAGACTPETAGPTDPDGKRPPEGMMLSYEIVRGEELSKPLPGRMPALRAPLPFLSLDDAAPASIVGKWTYTDIFSTQFAYVSAAVEYYGEQARNNLTWDAFGISDGTRLWGGSASEPGLGAFMGLSHYNYETRVRLTLNRICGFNLQAGTTHTAWRQVRIPIPDAWGHVYATSSSSWGGDPCPPDETGGGGGGGEGSGGTSPEESGWVWIRCYYYQELDQDTGEVLSETFLGCNIL
ncbi:MAG: hypothetical protein HOP28_01175 [Gemmatimonadales bacterium]|nr:hypothetical protein [Gemmatimonadales bacterium]